MYRTHTCGALRIDNLNEEVLLSGWIQRIRNLGAMTFIDLRDRYGITQLFIDTNKRPDLAEQAREMGREFVVKARGKVIERTSKNLNLPTGEIEIEVAEMEVLSQSKLPPFTIEENTDGGDELRMKYRYLDLRRSPVMNNLILRHQMAGEVRKYLSDQGFLEIETPFLIKSTPEGARDFVVPSRMNPGEFYALPQSPQTFKQLLMISGYDKYFQIVKCFRDEDLRADRQPEFTQVDCEMSFVERDDVLSTFEGLARHLFSAVKGVNIEGDFPRMNYFEAMEKYGTDKPDLRFGMELHEITSLAKGNGFKVFDNAEYIGGICVKGEAEYSRKKLDELTGFVQKPQIGAKGLVYIKYNPDGTFKSSIDKFYDEKDFKKWTSAFEAMPGDLLLILAGDKKQTRYALSELRLEMGRRLNLTDPEVFKPLWIVDFPLLEWDEEAQRYFAMHHPFTSPKMEDLPWFESDPAKVRADAYDLVINGVEIGGGSIRIHDKDLQDLMFKNLGFTQEEAKKQFGFLMDAFQYGAPPHGGVAFGFDRWVSVFAGLSSIRDVIAFPKNNMGRDVMIDTPSEINLQQLDELNLKPKKSE